MHRSINFAFCLGVAAFAGSLSRGFAAEPFITKNLVFRSQSEGYHTYRVPGLIATRVGTLLFFTDARVNGKGDIGKMDLVVKRSTDGGETWSPLKVIATDSNKDAKVGNVSAVLDEKTGAIHVVYCENLIRAFVTTSTDDGLTFGQPVEITDVFQKFPEPWKFFATGHAHGIQLASGRLVVPIFISKVARTGGERRNEFRVGVIYSDDHGVHWQAGGLVAGSELLNENTIFETADSALVMNARTTLRMRKQSVSKDGGMTWSPLKSVDPRLNGARCQASTLVTRDADGKRVVLFTNPIGTPDMLDTKISKDDRLNLTVRMSYDDGKTWPFAKVIEANPSGYGDLASLADGSICIGYETGKNDLYETLSIACFNLEWIKSEPQAIYPPDSRK